MFCLQPPESVLQLLASAALAWDSDDEGDLDESEGLQFAATGINGHMDLDVASPPNKAGQVINKQTILDMSPVSFQNSPKPVNRVASENGTMNLGLDARFGDLDFAQLPKDLRHVDDLRQIIARSRGLSGLDADALLNARTSPGMQGRSLTEGSPYGVSMQSSHLQKIMALAQQGPPGLDAVHSLDTGLARKPLVPDLSHRSLTDGSQSCYSSHAVDFFDPEVQLPMHQNRTRTAPAHAPPSPTFQSIGESAGPCRHVLRSSTSSGQPSVPTPSLFTQSFQAPRSQTYTHPSVMIDDVERKRQETSDKIQELSILLQLRQSQVSRQQPSEERVPSRPSALHQFPRLEQRPEQDASRSGSKQGFANQSNLTSKLRPMHGPKAARSATLQSSALRPTARSNTAGLVARSETACSSGAAKSQQNPPKPSTNAPKSMHHIALEAITPPDSDAEIERINSVAKHGMDEEVIVGPTSHAVAPKTFEELWIPGVLGNEAERFSVISRPSCLSLADVFRLGNAGLQVKPTDALETTELAESDPQPHRSFGSLLHFYSPDVVCRPCMFERIPGRCRKAVLCDFCHMHSGRKRRGVEAES